jgi:hypothetical protein
MFLDVTNENRDLYLSEDLLDFTYCEYGRLSETKVINFHNKFPFEVECNWILMPTLNSAGTVAKK